MADVPRHQCLIYDGSPSRHLPAIATSIIARLSANNRCLCLNSPPMVAGLRSALAAGGLDVAGEVKKGSLILSSDQGHLIETRFDAERMLMMLRNAIHQAHRDGYDGLWATGDMTWEFGNQNNLANLLEYECGLEDLFREEPTLSGICQYHRDTLPDSALQRAIYVHPAVYINETLSRVNPYHRQCGSMPPELPALSTSQLEGMLSRLNDQR